jgi:hypothetical protein
MTVGRMGRYQREMAYCALGDIYEIHIIMKNHATTHLAFSSRMRDGVMI